MKSEKEALPYANQLAAAMLVAGLVNPPHKLGVVLSPGSRNTPLALAFQAHPAVRLFVVLDERAAAFVALGMAKATGRAAIALCTSGSAGAHYGPAITEAHAAALPLVVITADRPPSLHGVGAPQTISQAGFGLGLVRRFIALEAPEKSDLSGEFAPYSLRIRAWRTQGLLARTCAEGVCPGPVHVNAPFVEPLWAPGSDLWARERVAALPPVHTLTAGLSAAPAKSLKTFFEKPRGLIVCGPDAASRPGGAQLRARLLALCKKLGWPLLADPGSQMRRQGLASENACPRYASFLQSRETAERLRPECILRIGAWPPSRVLTQFLAQLPEVPQLIFAEHEAACDPRHNAQWIVAASCAKTIGHVLRLPPTVPDASWLRAWQAAETMAANEEPKNFGDLERVVCAAPKGRDFLFLANSTPIRNIAEKAPEGVSDQVDVVTSRGVSGIDGNIATLVGLSLARPKSHVYALLGDLTFLHDLGALQTAAQLRVSITLIVILNGGGRIFEQLAIKAHKTNFESLFVTPQVADFEALARATGAYAETVHDAQALAHRLRFSKAKKAPRGVRIYFVQEPAQAADVD